MKYQLSKLVRGPVAYFHEWLPSLPYETLDWLNGRLFDYPRKMELLQLELERREAESLGIAA